MLLNLLQKMEINGNASGGTMANIYLIAFDSTQQALRTEMLLEFADIEIDIYPTPKQITAGCALSIAFPCEDLNRVTSIIQDEQVEVRGIFKPVADAYEQLTF
jgi:hypothetical protein